MAGIFLSHSSKDKLFVQKLAIELSTEGFPVWFDSWELEAGDQLHRQIEEGIDDSTFLVVVLSKNSVESEWVDRELARALHRERDLGRKFVIPIVVDNCVIPAPVANRIYSNFRDNAYQTALETLTNTLARSGAKDVAVDAKHRIVPLVFTNGVYLNRELLSDSLTHIPMDHVFDLAQFVLGPDENYLALRVKLQQAVDDVANWPEYTPELEQWIHYSYKRTKLLESGLLLGMKQLLEGLRRDQYGDPAFWFCRMVREELLGNLWGSQRSASETIIGYGQSNQSRPMGSNIAAARFYNVSSVDSVECFPREGSGQFGAWIDADSKTARDLHDYVGFPEPLLGVCSPEIIYKYLIPQMLYSNLKTPRGPVTFDFESYMIGLA